MSRPSFQVTLSILILFAQPRTVLPQSAKGSDQLELVVKSIAENESLYQDYEAEVHIETRNFDISNAMHDVTYEKIDDRRIVRQGKYRRFESSWHDTLNGKVLNDFAAVSSYDGRLTRKITGNVANLVHEDVTNTIISYPHMLVLERSRALVPLSVLVAGGERLRAHPDAGSYASFYKSSTEFVGTDAVNGLNCVKLRMAIEYGSKVKKTDYRFVWLAVDRNYLPVRTEAIQSIMSETIPIEIGQVTEFKEVEPGIWFPAEVRVDVHHDLDLRNGIVKISNGDKYTLSRISLNPDHPERYFSDVDFPPGTLVNEVKNGKIIRNYVVKPTWKSYGKYLYVIPLVAGPFAAIAVYFLWSRMK
jgi:hypothetical protein